MTGEFPVSYLTQKAKAFIFQCVYAPSNGPVKKWLVLAFKELDPYKRDWLIFRARDAYNKSTGIPGAAVSAFAKHPLLAGMLASVDWDAPDTREDRLFWHAQTELASRMAICANSECVRPYYFRVRPKQKMCSEECRKHALQINNARWRSKKKKTA